MIYAHLPSITPSQSSQVSSELSLHVLRFGNNSQTTSRPTSAHFKRIWTLRWQSLTLAEIKTLDDFFTAQQGTPFYWSPPDLPGTGLYQCRQWQIIPHSAAMADLTSRLETL